MTTTTVRVSSAGFVSEGERQRVDAIAHRALAAVGAPAGRLRLRLVEDQVAMRDGRLMAAGCATLDAIELWEGTLA